MTEKVLKYGDAYEDANGLLFTLDGITYLCMEDPEDGYRSTLGSFHVVEDVVLSNTFPPVEVRCVMRTKDPDADVMWESKCDDHVLEMYATANNTSWCSQSARPM